MQRSFTAFFLVSLMAGYPVFAAGLDELSKKPEAPSAPKLATPPAPKAAPAPKPAVPVKPETTESEAEADHETHAPEVKEGTAAVQAKPVTKSASSKALENRLSIGTSLGWSIVKPSKGTWIGLGSSDASFRWRLSPKEDSSLFVTGRYAPFAGVWRTGNRDYDTTLHGIYGGAEYFLPMHLGSSLALKGMAELGYMIIYASAQDGAPEASEVKKGNLNLTAGGAAEWSLVSNKIKMGPFIRLHAIGFNIVTIGGSAQFVF